MSEFDPVAALKTYHDAINALDFETIDHCFADGAVYISGGTGNTEGRAAILEAFRHYFEIYPDQIAEDEHIEQTGPRSVFSIWHLTATHHETGEKLNRRGTQHVTFNKDGKIIRVEVEDEV